MNNPFTNKFFVSKIQRKWGYVTSYHLCSISSSPNGFKWIEIHSDCWKEVYAKYFVTDLTRNSASSFSNLIKAPKPSVPLPSIQVFIQSTKYSLYSFWYLHNNVEYLRMGWYVRKEAEYDGFILAFCLLGWSFNTSTMHPAYKMFSAKENICKIFNWNDKIIL